MIRLATLAIALSLTVPALADGLPRPPPGPPPGPPPQLAPAWNGPLPAPSQSCMMTALQLGYQTGRREVAYAATEACMAAGSRGAILPYGFYGPYVPPQGIIPPGWLIPFPGY